MEQLYELVLGVLKISCLLSIKGVFVFEFSFILKGFILLLLADLLNELKTLRLVLLFPEVKLGYII